MTVDLNAIQAAIVAGLPITAKWTVGETSLDFDFSVAQDGLPPLPDDALEDGETAWLDLRVFGDFDVADGGGANPYVCIRQSDGAVYGLDLERDTEGMFLFNSSIDQFIETFVLLDQYLSKGKSLPSPAEVRVKGVDPAAYPHSEWKLLVDHLRGKN
jgi:hypothetical protein